METMWGYHNLKERLAKVGNPKPISQGLNIGGSVNSSQATSVLSVASLSCRPNSLQISTLYGVGCSTPPPPTPQKSLIYSGCFQL